MEVSSILMENLFSHYTVKEKDIANLYKYLSIRCGLALDDKKWTSANFIEFILSELNIQTFGKHSKYVIYNDDKYSIISIAFEFMDDFKFRAEIYGDISYKELMKEVYHKGYIQASKYKKLNEYKSHIKLNRLNYLNSKLKITPVSSMGIDGFYTNEKHNPFKRTLEEKLEADIQAEKFAGTTDTSYISEKDLEDYVIKNLDLIEDGLVYMGRQIEVQGGIIDVIAKDKDNVITIIELKIDEDKSIVWQSIHYPEEIKKKYKVNHVRMITFAPEYSDGLLTPLRSLKNVEICKYSIEVNSGKINNLKVEKI